MMANKLVNPAPAGPVLATLASSGNPNKAQALANHRVAHLRKDEGVSAPPSLGQGWPRMGNTR